MKFTNPQLIVIVVVLFAAIILAHVFAPGATSTVVSMATTLFGVLFVNRDKGEPPGPPAAGGGSGGAPDLKVIDGGLKKLALAIGLGLFVLGCGPSFDDLERAATGGDVTAKKRLCDAEARSAYYVDEKPGDEAIAIWHACLKREGLEK